ncbi:hypothetical protein V5799_010695 [Amblyomma americanum]|uniref:Uncharacterized protein n=1 Tax=Amblyomma americanum TaxID=6943 RepID=A0AAQ4EK08_AMBAM
MTAALRLSPWQRRTTKILSQGVVGRAALKKGALKRRSGHDSSDSPLKFPFGKYFSSDMQSTDRQHEEADLQLQRSAAPVALELTDFKLSAVTQPQLNPSVIPNETGSITPLDDTALPEGSSATVEGCQPLTEPHQNNESTVLVASPQASPRSGSNETEDASLSRETQGDMASNPTRQENEKCYLIETEDAPELFEGEADSTQASTWSAPWSRHLLGLDSFGRSYWPGNSPQINVFFTRSNWTGGELPWIGRQWGSPVPPVFLAPEDSGLYLYEQLLRERSSSLGNGKKRSTACLGVFIFLVSMFCVWMFYAVGEYRAPSVGPAPNPFYGSQPAPFDRANDVGISGPRVPIDEARAAEIGRDVEPISSDDNSADTTRLRKGKPELITDQKGIVHRLDSKDGARITEEHGN